ncbi:MAG TPA: hypothetical protein VGK57_05605, partial [Candidatus Binatia bacterium]
MSKDRSSWFRVSAPDSDPGSKHETRSTKLKKPSAKYYQQLPQRLLQLFVIFLLALPTISLAQRKTLRVSYPAPAT